jgi:hypothetical protein
MSIYCSSEFIKPEKDYIERNRDIVDETDMLIAFPIPTSKGTWSTIGYAKREKKKVLIVFPDGTFKYYKY